MNKPILDLYSAYLQISSGQTSATVLSRLVEGELSHDKISRFLSTPCFTSKDLWHLVKSTVRQVEQEDGVLIIDDTVEEKAYMDENDLICWHYDHVKGRTVKGINMVSALYYQGSMSIPVGFEMIRKTEKVIDKKTGKERRISPINKNQYYRAMIKRAVENQLKFKYVLSDSWYSSAENMNLIHKELGKHFIMALKEGRNVALSLEDKSNGHYQYVETLDLKEQQPYIVYLAKVPFALALTKQVFKHEDGTTACLYLVSSDTTMDGDQTSTIYPKRWKVEEFFKSLKSNLSFSKSPAHTPTTQSNHCFAAIYGFFKLEKLAISYQTNHFALKAKMYLNALKAAFKELQRLKANADIPIAFA